MSLGDAGSGRYVIRGGSVGNSGVLRMPSVLVLRVAGFPGLETAMYVSTCDGEHMNHCVIVS